MVGRMLARTLLGSVFLLGGYQTLQNPVGAAGKLGAALERYVPDAAEALPVKPEELVRANALGMMIAGSTLALGIFPRLSALTLVALLAPTNVVGHGFWEDADPATRAANKNSFMKNLAITGGLLYVALTPKPKS